MDWAGGNDPYVEFCKKNPELAARVQAAVDKGRAQLEQGSLDEARREFQRALALCPYVPPALNNLALLAYGEGDRERAKTYLEQLLAFMPAEPTANALLARYWLAEGSVPLAVKHAEIAAQSVIALVAKNETNDPSRLRRSLEFCCQALAELEDDALLIHVYTETGRPELLPTTLAHVAIAFYNRGRIDAAMQLWRTAAEMAPDETPAQVYLDMAEVILQHQLPPFRLDHQFADPEQSKERRVWLTRAPSYMLAAALAQTYRGSGAEAEDALPLLAGIGLPGFRRILADVARDVTRPERLRLLAGLQMVVAGDFAGADQVVDMIERDSLSTDDEALWCLLAAMLAEAGGDSAAARRLAENGMALLADSALPQDHPFRQMLSALAQRIDEKSASAQRNIGAAATGRGPQSAAKPDPKKGAATDARSMATLRLPDAEWLRLALQTPLHDSLEEMLEQRPRDAVVELARRLGEHAPERIDNASLVRRLAMRLRSLPLERIIGQLSPAARHFLQWLSGQGGMAKLALAHAWLGSELLEAEPWHVVEELYHAGLIEIGRSASAAAALPARADDLQLAIPLDLRSRLGGAK